MVKLKSPIAGRGIWRMPLAPASSGAAASDSTITRTISPKPEGGDGQIIAAHLEHRNAENDADDDRSENGDRHRLPIGELGEREADCRR